MKTLFTYRHLHECGHETLFVLLPKVGVEAALIVDVIMEDIETNLGPDDVMLAVPTLDFDRVEELFRSHPQVTTLLARMKGRTSVTLLSYNEGGQETSRKTVSGAKPPTSVSLSAIVRPAVTHIFRSNGGFVQASNTYHFVNPSGRHTARFIRLSNILTRGREIQFLAFALLPLIPAHAEEVYIDTPALYSILAGVNEFRSIFGKRSLEVENFRSYEGLHLIAPSVPAAALVVISASSSGGLGLKIESESAIPRSNIVQFLFLGHNPPQFRTVCDLSNDPVENPDGLRDVPNVFAAHACELCRQGSFQVHLHGDQFDMKGPQPEPIQIKRDDGPTGLGNAIDRLSQSNALGVCAGAPARERNRDFFVDTTGLFSGGPVAKRLDYILRRSVPASTTHIIAIDDSSEVLAQKILAHVSSTGGTARVLKASEIDLINKKEEPSIVVAAAAIESGRCLTDVSRDLRSVAEQSPICYLVGVEKTTGLARRESLKRTLVQCPHPVKHEFVTVESLILPPSSNQNSWNDELDLLQNPDFYDLITPNVRELIKKRIERLRKTSEPLKDDLFLPTVTNEKLSLQPGFVFWPTSLSSGKHSQADVFFTIASVLQQLRANSQSSLAQSAIRNIWFHQTVIDPSNFARFNDDIIQASLLRAARPSELNYRDNPDESREIGRIINRIVRAANLPRGGAAPEFLLSIACKRMSLRADDLSSIVSEATASIGILPVLAEIIRRTSPEIA